MSNLVWFRGNCEIEKVHPIEGGFWRLKFRRDRRPELGTESPVIFYPKYLLHSLWKQVRWARLFLHHYMILREVLRHPARSEYTDLAVTPVQDDEIETHEMFQTDGARKQLEKIREIEKHRHSVAA